MDCFPRPSGFRLAEFASTLLKKFLCRSGYHSASLTALRASFHACGCVWIPCTELCSTISYFEAHAQEVSTKLQVKISSGIHRHTGSATTTISAFKNPNTAKNEAKMPHSTPNPGQTPSLLISTLPRLFPVNEQGPKTRHLSSYRPIGQYVYLHLIGLFTGLFIAD